MQRLPAAEHAAGVKTLARRRTVSDYKTIRRRLPETGKQQLMLVHGHATAECAMDQDFFVPAEGAGPPLDRFSAQYMQAVACAARPDWSAFLWQRRVEAQLITPYQVMGLQVWRISAEAEAWACVVREGIRAHLNA
jgi:hypothetical protein